MKSLCRLIEPKSPILSVRQQCGLLSASRSSLYYQPKVEKPENLKMMGIMDKHLLNHNSEGVVSMVCLMTGLGFVVVPNRIWRLFSLMGRQTIYRRKNLTKMGIYPPLPID